MVDTFKYLRGEVLKLDTLELFNYTTWQDDTIQYPSENEFDLHTDGWFRFGISWSKVNIEEHFHYREFIEY